MCEISDSRSLVWSGCTNQAYAEVGQGRRNPRGLVYWIYATGFAGCWEDCVFLRLAGVLGVLPVGAGADQGGAGVRREDSGGEAVDW